MEVAAVNKVVFLQAEVVEDVLKINIFQVSAVDSIH